MSLINVRKENGVAIVELLLKRLDAAVAGAFKEAVVAVIHGGEKKVVLDMSGVDFVDSSGLGSLVSILKSLGGTGSLAVCDVRPNVLSLFKLTRMDKVFSIQPSALKAAESLAS